MSNHSEEVYADPWSDIDSDTDKVSSSSSEDTDCERDITEEPNSPQRVLSPNASDEDRSNSNEDSEWLESDVKPESHDFMGQPGIQINSTDLNDVKSVIDLIIGDDLMELLVTESNRYHRQASKTVGVNKNKDWSDVTVAEMKRFLSLIILMGFVKKSDKDEYWSTDPLLCTPIFGNTMTRNRFNQIWKYWHFNNNKDCRNRLDKIKPVLVYFREKCQGVYKPERELCLDENIIAWRGKLSFRGYDLTRSVRKHGILVRTVCESISGYICNLELYCSREDTLQSTVFPILSPFLDLWHNVYMNSYYNTVTIAEELLRHKTGVCGAVKKTGGVPNCLNRIRLTENTAAFHKKNNTLIQAWRTKKSLVYVTSTIHSARVVETVNHKTNDKTRIPECVLDYNKYVKNMDRVDQYLFYHSVLRKTKKWTKRVVLYLLNCSLFNAYKIYSKVSGNNMKLRKFLLAVARTWLESMEETSDSGSDDMQPITSTKKAPKHDPTGRLCSDMKKHRIIRITGHGNIQNPRRACRVCTAAKKRSSTAFMCSSCNVPLHVGKCFENYHTLAKY